jgi:hypothetical protein
MRDSPRLMALPLGCAASLGLAGRGPVSLTVFDRKRSKTAKGKRFAAGKSQTCRASGWQSHCTGHLKTDAAHALSQLCLPLLKRGQGSANRFRSHRQLLDARLIHCEPDARFVGRFDRAACRDRHGRFDHVLVPVARAGRNVARQSESRQR